MENVAGILNVLEVCLLIGVIIICIVLVISGVLRWLAPSDKRHGRLNIASWISFTVLVLMTAYSQKENIKNFFSNSDGSQTLTSVVIIGSKMTVKILLLAAVFAIAAIALLIFIVLVSKGVQAAFYAKNSKIQDWAGVLKEKSNQFGTIIKTPIFTFFVTCGILLIFIILPLLLGDLKGEAGLAKTWIDGVETFASAVSSDEAMNTESDEEIPIPEAIITYILVYVIVLGVGFAVTRILYAIIKDNLKKKKKTNLIDEYSGSMGILGVGVSILLVLQDSEVDIYQDRLSDVVFAFFKYFVIVAIVLALSITILEVIRLVMDMRESLIRKEARYLFIALVGQVSLLILTMINSIFSAMNSAIGQKYNEIDISQIQNKLVRRITNTMDEEIDQSIDNGKVTFKCFGERVTKK